MNPKLTVIIILVCGVAAAVSALRCYDCVGTNKEKNKCFGKPSKDHIYDCDELTYVYERSNSSISSFHKVEKKKADSRQIRNWMCAKLAAKSGDDKAELRGCADMTAIIPDQCESDEYEGVKGTLCVCGTDECNSAVPLSSALAFVTLNVCVAFALVYSRM